LTVSLNKSQVFSDCTVIANAGKGISSNFMLEELCFDI
jgi:hypothetical protein